MQSPRICLPESSTSQFSSTDVFDRIGARYSESYGANAAHIDTIRKLMKLIPAGGKVLDIGCGTGRPTLSMLAEADLDVIAIDSSATMIDTARRNVPTTHFHCCDARDFWPKGPSKFDAIVAILTLFIMPTTDIESMAYKMAHWLKPGGFLVLGTIDFTDVPKAKGYPSDPRGQWLYHRFMDEVVKDNTFGVGRWISVLRQAGLTLESTSSNIFDPSGPSPSIFEQEPQCFILCRKSRHEPLLGPHPQPHDIRQPRNIQVEGWRDLVPRLNFTLPNDLEDCLTTQENMLYLGRVPSLFRSTNANCQHTWMEDFDITRFYTEYSCDSRFTGVIAAYTLHLVDDLDQYLRHIIRCIKSSASGSEVMLLEPAPFNGTLSLINNVAGQIGSIPDHYGASLTRAMEILKEHGLNDIRLELVNCSVGFIEADSTERCDIASNLLAKCWFHGQHVDGHLMAERLLRLKVEEYFEDQVQMFGHPFRIDFASVMLRAK